MKKSVFAPPLGAALPGGPSQSTWIRGWIKGSMLRVKSSVPVGTSIAAALEEASSMANQPRSARFLPDMDLPPTNGPALITGPCAVLWESRGNVVGVGGERTD